MKWWNPFKAALPVHTKAQGDAAESIALAHLQAHGLKLLQRNFKTPGRGGGEIDLVMQSADGTVVFVEVRKRQGMAAGGAQASVTHTKRQRIVFAAKLYLQRHAGPQWPACRFDVVAVQDGRIEWLQAAFDADGR